MRRVLLVGASGVLRPAVAQLAMNGDHVYALARDGRQLGTVAARAGGRVTTIAADYHDETLLADRLATATRGGLFDAAILYCPTASPTAISFMSSATSGPIVHILTSDTARPIGDEPFELASTTNPIQLVLGWAHESGSSRWHTPEEISAAALHTLNAGRAGILGTVRPWSERPQSTGPLDNG